MPRKLNGVCIEAVYLFSFVFRVETEIFHLPRYVESTAFPSSLVPSPGESELPMESPYDLKIVPLVTTRVISGKPEPSQINAHVS